MSEYDPGDYNRSGMNAFIFSMVSTMAFFLYVAFVHNGVDLKEIPQEKVEKAAEATTESPAETTEASEATEE